MSTTPSGIRARISTVSVTVAAILAVAWSGLAQATVITANPTPYDAYLQGGQVTLQLDQNSQDFLDVVGLTVQSNNLIDQPAVVLPPDSATTTLVNNLTSVTGGYESVNGTTYQLSLTGFQSDNLGFTITTPVSRLAPLGGSLTISDMFLNTTTSTVTGTIQGTNGLGTLHNVTLWNVAYFDSASTPGNAVPGADFQNYTLTVNAYALSNTDALNAALVQSLSLNSISEMALRATDPFGKLTVTAVVASPMGALVDVPEAGTSLLMGVGFLGLVLARRRQRAQH